jgi:hypothetical protein
MLHYVLLMLLYPETIDAKGKKKQCGEMEDVAYINGLQTS